MSYPLKYFPVKGKTNKWHRISKELENDLADTDRYNPEAAADLRWAVVLLRRAIQTILEGR